MDIGSRIVELYKYDGRTIRNLSSIYRSIFRSSLVRTSISTLDSKVAHGHACNSIASSEQTVKNTKMFFNPHIEKCSITTIASIVRFARPFLACVDLSNDILAHTGGAKHVKCASIFDALAFAFFCFRIRFQE